jgi:hypothetical protein
MLLLAADRVVFLGMTGENGEMVGLRRAIVLIVLAILRLGVPVVGIWLLCIGLEHILGDQQQVEWPASRLMRPNEHEQH